MKTKTINIYSFSELSDKAKEYAIDEYRNRMHEYFWADENRETLEKFAEIFPIKVTYWSYGDRGEGVNFHFTDNNNLEELSGIRLAAFIWNNYRGDIFKGRYYHCENFGMTDHRIKHNRVRSTEIKTGPNKGKFINSYYSAIQLTTDYPLTGYCMDMDILDPIYNFLNKPDSSTFYDLLNDCFEGWVKACNADIDYQNSDECISENIEANDYEFTEEGKMY